MNNDTNKTGAKSAAKTTHNSATKARKASSKTLRDCWNCGMDLCVGKASLDKKACIDWQSRKAS
jgi:hypothetical protein